MKPKEFSRQNVVIGANQQGVLPLPAHVTPEGVVVSCWALDPAELLLVQSTGCIYITQVTFNQPPMPLGAQVQDPFIPTQIN